MFDSQSSVLILLIWNQCLDSLIVTSINSTVVSLSLVMHVKIVVAPQFLLQFIQCANFYRFDLFLHLIYMLAIEGAFCFSQQGNHFQFALISMNVIISFIFGFLVLNFQMLTGHFMSLIFYTLVLNVHGFPTFFSCLKIVHS